MYIGSWYINEPYCKSDWQRGCINDPMTVEYDTDDEDEAYSMTLDDAVDWYLNDLPGNHWGRCESIFTIDDLLTEAEDYHLTNDSTIGELKAAYIDTILELVLSINVEEVEEEEDSY